MLQPSRYSALAIALHWALTFLLLFQVGLGSALEHLPKGVAQFAGYQFHKSVGILILLLSIGRLGVRLVRARPAPVPGNRLQMLAAKAVHGLLYAVMIGGPLTGWVIVSTAKVRLQTMLFGLVPWPDLPLGQGWHEPAEALHGLLGPVTLGLAALHVAGALHHHIRREDVIGRMLPAALGGSRRATGIVAALAVLAGLAALGAGRSLSFAPRAPAAPAASLSEPASTAVASDASDEGAALESGQAQADQTAAPAPDATAQAAAEPANAVPWTVQPGGRLGFTADYGGEAIAGTFKRWDAAIVFDPADLKGSTIRATIDLASVESGDAQRDDMLRSDSFFGIGSYPRAEFASRAIRQTGEGRYVAEGTLSLHGRSRPLKLGFALRIDGDRALAIGQARLQRLDFGVGEAEWSATDQLKDAVAVDFRFSAVRRGP
ncbi:MAG: YceI family protein [Novosphingobium sp.]